MTIYPYLMSIPSVCVAYMMVCRLNAKKRRFFSVEGWAYLMILGGAIFTFYTVMSFGRAPTLGKLMLDIGLCLYFGAQALRIGKWQRWHDGK